MSTSPHFVILVAEDDEDDRFLLQQAFTKHQPGCQLEFFNDGRQLLDSLPEQTPTPLPALILLDLNMPVLDGLSTLKLLKEDTRLRKVPVLILTTSDAEQEIKLCYEAGANAFMTKPASYAELVSQIDLTLQYWLQVAKLPFGK